MLGMRTGGREGFYQWGGNESASRFHFSGRRMGQGVVSKDEMVFWVFVGGFVRRFECR